MLTDSFLLINPHRESDPGIGGEVLRWIGKAIVAEIKPELQEAAGWSTTLCRSEGRNEAAAHAMRNILEEEDTDAVLLDLRLRRSRSHRITPVS